MTITVIALLAALFFTVAVLYSSVGHAGASGYIAAMSLVSMSVPEIRPTALALNLVVGAIGLYRFSHAGHVAWRAVLPLVLASAPMAWAGARLKLPPGVHELALAAVLVVAALGLLRSASGALNTDNGLVPRVPWIPGAVTGAAIGLVSGITGTGGAIFLTPLLLWLRWKLFLNSGSATQRWVSVFVALALFLAFSPLWAGGAVLAWFGVQKYGAPAVTIAFALCQIVWLWMGVVSGALGRTFELDKFLRFPIPPRSVFVINVVASLLEPVCLMTVPTLVAVALAVADHNGVAAGLLTAFAGLLLSRIGSEFVERFDRHKGASDARRAFKAAGFADDFVPAPATLTSAGCDALASRVPGFGSPETGGTSPVPGVPAFGNTVPCCRLPVLGCFAEAASAAGGVDSATAGGNSMGGLEGGGVSNTPS